VPDTFVLATNRRESVRDFARLAFQAAGMQVEFSGKAEQEIARDTTTGKTVLRVNPAFYRPAEVELLIGDPTKAQQVLGWKAGTSLEELCRLMVEADLARHKAGIRVF
jgi:GDPmannose 4,6-dehydratase